MKAYTDIVQSKKLAEILPIESADMFYTSLNRDYPWIWIDKHLMEVDDIPCWSLTALLNILDYPQLSKDKIGDEKVGWMVSVYPDNCRYDSIWYNSPIDACYEMILKLHELKML